MPSLPTAGRAVLKIGIYGLRAEVADTEDLRRRGLMFRLRQAPDEGMLFVFPERQRVCLWMKYTFIPLSAAFVGDDSVIIGMARMTPLSLQRHCANKPVRVALEAPTDWFEARAVGLGTRISGFPAEIGVPAP
jgi:uncharacterized membrane protein (UPF0127 family)